MDPSTVSAIADSVTAGAALAASIVAGMGLVTWRKQLKGRTEYDLARRMLKKTYRLREAVRAARSPMILGGEFAAASDANGDEDQQPSRSAPDDEAIAAVYDQRWKRVAKVRADLEMEVFEAEALWGTQETETALQPLRGFLGRLFAVMSEHVMRLRGGVHAADDERGIETRRRLLGGGEEDKLGDHMEAAIEKVEEFLRPHLEL